MVFEEEAAGRDGASGDVQAAVEGDVGFAHGCFFVLGGVVGGWLNGDCIVVIEMMAVWLRMDLEVREGGVDARAVVYRRDGGRGTKALYSGVFL